MKYILLSLIILSTLSISCKDTGDSLSSNIVQVTEPDINAFIPVDESPVPTNQVQPKYPEVALKNNITGTIWVKALIAMDGTVRKAVVVKRKDGSPDLETAALTATYQWTFTPAKKDNKPVNVWVMIPFRFATNKSN